MAAGSENPGEGAREVRVEIRGLILDPTSNAPIVLLKDRARDRILPIWIGPFEANAIALHLEGIKTPRPMTHDLLRLAITRLGAQVERVVISELRDNTFFATIHLAVQGGSPVELDARPSDAIALAVRERAPLFVREEILDRAKAPVAETEDDEQRLKQILEELDTDDMGRYTM